ncbi:hypothetical protein H6768_06635 [Candidatus Peribacteria bacterium]|nr:hypothetical protein [Candidatus Peribacteria bacterium]
MFVQYLDQIFLVGPSNLLSTIIPGGKELNGQEFLVEYAGGMVPVLVVSSIKNG